MCSVEIITPSLESILDNPNSILFKEFERYLNQSYCNENLSFWISTQKYLELKDKEKQIELGNKMIQLYIKQNSTQEINIPCDTRQKILDYNRKGEYPIELFNEAAETVLELMRVNSFLPWSTHYYSNSILTSSLSSFSFIENSNINKIKNQNSRKSCSSLDYSPFINHIPFDSTTINTGTKYKSILKRLKRSLLGQPQTKSSTTLDKLFISRSSLQH